MFSPHQPSQGVAVRPARPVVGGGKDGSRKAGLTAMGGALSRGGLLLALLLPQPSLAADPGALAAAARRVERHATQVAERAEDLASVARQVEADRRLHSLDRMKDRLALLEEDALRLERAVVILERLLEEPAPQEPPED